MLSRYLSYSKTTTLRVRPRCKRALPCIHNSSGGLRSFAGFSQPENSSSGSNRWFQAGAFLLTLVVAEKAWDFYKEQEVKNEFQSTLDMMQQDANAYSARQQGGHKEAAKMPTLFNCEVVDTHASLDGTLMLRNVKVGDVVQVLTAEIGPGQNYHLCRLGTSANPQAVGWYPKDFLKEL